MKASMRPRLGHTDLAGDLGSRVASRLHEHDVQVTADLDGVEALFLVPVHERVDRVAVHTAAVDSAVAAGVRHIVYPSFLNTSPRTRFTLSRDHYATEQHIRGSGVAFTFLRASAYLEVAQYVLGADDVIRGPAGSGRVAFVSKDDVADVAVTVLLDPSPHAGVTCDLTGPTAVSLHELAEAFTHTAGRPITYVEETVEAAYASRAHFDMPRWQLDAWVSTYLQVAAGELDMVTDDVERLLGRGPTSLEDFLAEHPEVLARPR
jgi:uncharacterized protein YbjT (DUF2867 family)